MIETYTNTDDSDMFLSRVVVRLMPPPKSKRSTAQHLQSPRATLVPSSPLPHKSTTAAEQIDHPDRSHIPYGYESFRYPSAHCIIISPPGTIMFITRLRLFLHCFSAPLLRGTYWTERTHGGWFGGARIHCGFQKPTC